MLLYNHDSGLMSTKYGYATLFAISTSLNTDHKLFEPKDLSC